MQQMTRAVRSVIEMFNLVSCFNDTGIEHSHIGRDDINGEGDS